MTKYYTLSQAADVLKIKPHVIAYLLTTKKVPEPMRVGHRRLFTEADIAAIKEVHQNALASRFGLEDYASK